jgi:hypothetical protein
MTEAAKAKQTQVGERGRSNASKANAAQQNFASKPPPEAHEASSRLYLLRLFVRRWNF